MIALNELSRVIWNITRLDITARDNEGKFLHRWIYGEQITETIHMYHERIAGRLTIVEGKINGQGDMTRGGAEIGWGLKTDLIPKQLLTAPVTKLTPVNYKSGRLELMMDVEMHPLTVMGLIPEEDEDGGSKEPNSTSKETN